MAQIFYNKVFEYNQILQELQRQEIIHDKMLQISLECAMLEHETEKERRRLDDMQKKIGNLT